MREGNDENRPADEWLTGDIETVRLRGRRLARLATVAAATVDFVSFADRCCEELAALVGDGCAAICMLAPSGALDVVSVRGVDPERVTHIPLSAHLPPTVAARTGSPVWLETADSVAEFASDLRTLLGYIPAAAAAVPMIGRRGLVGAVGVGSRTARIFDDADRTLLLDIAMLCAAAEGRPRNATPARRAHLRESLDSELLVPLDDLQRAAFALLDAASELPAGERHTLITRLTIAAERLAVVTGEVANLATSHTVEPVVVNAGPRLIFVFPDAIAGIGRDHAFILADAVRRALPASPVGAKLSSLLQPSEVSELRRRRELHTDDAAGLVAALGLVELESQGLDDELERVREELVWYLARDTVFHPGAS